MPSHPMVRISPATAAAAEYFHQFFLPYIDTILAGAGDAAVSGRVVDAEDDAGAEAPAGC